MLSALHGCVRIDDELLLYEQRIDAPGHISVEQLLAQAAGLGVLVARESDRPGQPRVRRGSPLYGRTPCAPWTDAAASASSAPASPAWPRPTIHSSWLGLRGLPIALAGRLVAGRRHGGRQGYVVTPEELSEEAGDCPRTATLIELVAAEAVDFVTGELQLPIFRHHLGMASFISRNSDCRRVLKAVADQPSRESRRETTALSSPGTPDGQAPVRAAGRRGSETDVTGAVLLDQQGERFLRVVVRDFLHQRAVWEVAVEEAQGSSHQ